MQESARQRYVFDEFTLDCGRASLLRAGRRVSLRPRAFDALKYLIENHGRVVAKEELIATLWPAVVVTDDSLAKCIQEARSALDDRAHRLIKTVPRRGYMFDVAVAIEARPATGGTKPVGNGAPRTAANTAEAGDGTMSDGAEANSSRRKLKRHGFANLVLAGVSVAAVAAIGASYLLGRGVDQPQRAVPKSVAVLPLENLSPDPDNDYFAAGVHDSILNELAKIGDVHTIARTSMLRYADGKKSIREIARELNVETVMEGSVRYADGRVRVTAQLIDPETDMHLWSEEYDRPLADIFDIQTDIAGRIAVALRAELSAEEQRSLRNPRTNSTEAYQLYLRGRYHWDKTVPEDLEKSIEYYEQAVRLDPSFALAYAGIADSYTILDGLGVSPPSALIPPAKAAVERALEIDPGLAEAYVSRGLIRHFFDWDYAGGDADFEHAIALNPNLAIAHHLYGKNLIVTQRFADSATELKLALELDPYSAAINKDLGETLYYERRYGEALEQFLKTLELEPGSTPISFWLTRSYEALGLRDEAVRAHLVYSRDRGWFDPDSAASGVLEDVYRRSGWKAYWRAWLTAVDTLPDAHYVEPYKLVEANVRIGATDEAFAWLEKCFEARSSWIPTLINDPLLDPLRGDPRFAELLRRAGLDAY